MLSLAVITLLKWALLIISLHLHRGTWVSFVSLYNLHLGKFICFQKGLQNLYVVHDFAYNPFLVLSCQAVTLKHCCHSNFRRGLFWQHLVVAPFLWFCGTCCILLILIPNNFCLWATPCFSFFSDVFGKMVGVYISISLQSYKNIFPISY